MIWVIVAVVVCATVVGLHADNRLVNDRPPSYYRATVSGAATAVEVVASTACPDGSVFWSVSWNANNTLQLYNADATLSTTVLPWVPGEYFNSAVVKMDRLGGVVSAWHMGNVGLEQYPAVNSLHCEKNLLVVAGSVNGELRVGDFGGSAQYEVDEIGHTFQARFDGQGKYVSSAYQFGQSPSFCTYVSTNFVGAVMYAAINCVLSGGSLSAHDFTQIPQQGSPTVYTGFSDISYSLSVRYVDWSADGYATHTYDSTETRVFAAGSTVTGYVYPTDGQDLVFTNYAGQTVATIDPTFVSNYSANAMAFIHDPVSTKTAWIGAAPMLTAAFTVKGTRWVFSDNIIGYASNTDVAVYPFHPNTPIPTPSFIIPYNFLAFVIKFPGDTPSEYMGVRSDTGMMYLGDAYKGEDGFVMSFIQFSGFDTNPVFEIRKFDGTISAKTITPNEDCVLLTARFDNEGELLSYQCFKTSLFQTAPVTGSSNAAHVLIDRSDSLVVVAPLLSATQVGSTVLRGTPAAGFARFTTKGTLSLL